MEAGYEKRGYLLEDFRLFHLRSAQGPGVDFHYHDFHKLLFLVSGNGSYTVEGRRYLLQPGDTVLVSRGSVHRPEIGGGSPYERYILYLSTDFLRQHSSEDWSPEALFAPEGGCVLRLEPERSRETAQRLSALEQEVRVGGDGSALLRRCLLLQALVQLYRDGCARNAPVAPVEGGDEKILAILHYLNDNLTEDISIDALSEQFFISKYHMMRRFREETGCSIHAYLSDKRLFLARDMIAGGSSATDACYQSGWRNYSTFSRAYRKRFFSTPTGRMTLYTGEIIE